MTNDRYRHCLFLLREADRILLEDGELVAAAHLSMTVETLHRRAAERAFATAAAA